MIGLQSPLKYHRLSGFMGDELKAGSLILSFCFIVSGYLINTDNNKMKGILLLCLFVVTIFITGDRSNFLKSLLIAFCLIFLLIKIYKEIYSVILSNVWLNISDYNNNNVFKERFKNKIFGDLSQNNFNIYKFVKKTEYGKIYSSAYELFLEKKSFGVGNKNFRILCEKDFRTKYTFTKDLEKAKCNTHPHQIYFEILVEHGIFGLSILFIALLSLFIKTLKLF